MGKKVLANIGSEMNLQMFSGQSIYDFVTSPEIAAYWTEKLQTLPPFLGEELFPNTKQIGTEIKWAKGGTGAPKLLKPSAFGAKAVPRGRKEFDTVLTKLGFFKESKYVDEDLRQQLNLVLASGNQIMIDTILNKIFDDITELVLGAAVTREVMRMQLLMTGKAEVEGNGMKYELDYEFNPKHMGNASISWSDSIESNPILDIQRAKEQIELDTGETPTRAVTNLVTLNQIVANTKINKTISVFGGGDIILGRQKVLQYLREELGLDVVVYDKLYEDESGNGVKYVPDQKFALLPGTPLGNTAFAITPEESDLMTSGKSNVSIVDTGVAVTTMHQDDPVQVETKVSMTSLPTFENMEKVFILDAVAQP
ncbi:major capsid protein [Enterococcus sp. BWB1-3]|uniref:major capsid protein n=1 Tax=Enterococcus sp. BWB1-3 TaxID=2787713 RepID=UPI0019209A2A|nr:major capsid protein [Enterococcus sp. BWB1-3]MBL1228139.1 major capsid protein [Enterococcus sp. BWB1-3]